MRIDVEAPFVLTKPLRDEQELYDLADEDTPWELLDGKLVMSPASDRHEDLFRFLMTILSAWLDERGLGVVRGSRYPMRLDPRWSPEPDLLVVTRAHEQRITPQRLEGPADLVIEIASEVTPPSMSTTSCPVPSREHPRDLAGGAPDVERARRSA